MNANKFLTELTKTVKTGNGMRLCLLAKRGLRKGKINLVGDSPEVIRSFVSVYDSVDLNERKRVTASLQLATFINSLD